MAYVDVVSPSRNSGRREMSGSLAIRLAEKAHKEGRLDEARGLVELAYRLFDEAADVTSPSSLQHVDELCHLSH